MDRFVIPLAIVLAMACAADPAAAQEQAAAQQESVKKQDTVPPATAPKLTEQAGTTEPSSKVQGTSAHPNAVFVNGMLTVPGAQTDVDTAPAKHSARTDADDQIPIVGYRFRKLSEAQRSEITKELGTQREAPGASAAGAEYAVIGAEIPSAIAMRSVVALPQSLTDKIPELRGTGFMRSADKFVIVALNNNMVVGVL